MKRMRRTNFRRWHRNHQEFHHKHRKDLHKYHICLKFLRPVAFLVNLFIIYLIFKFIGMKGIGIFFAVFFSIKEIAYIYFLWRLEKRIFSPIEKLKKGVDQIAQGNYNVKIESDVPNEIGVLIESFNAMTQNLQESEKMKLQYEENRKTLIANISHDLKTPITSIQGYIEVILESTTMAPEKTNRYLKTISNNITYMNTLIDDLFLFSKLDMQRLQFQFETIKIQPFMTDLMEELKLEFEEREIVCTYTEDMFTEDTNGQTRVSNDMVYIDGKRIYQAIRNIIGNAIKYGPEEGLVIAVELEAKEEYIYIHIKDNGPGIEEDKLEYVFDRFYRIDTERTKDLMSTGLGLSIAKELVEAHGGKIFVSSVLKEGSCFTIKLPRHLQKNN